MDKKTIDTTVTSNSSNLITSGAVYAAINSAFGLEGSISFESVFMSNTRESFSHSWVCGIHWNSSATTTQTTQSGAIDITYLKSSKVSFYNAPPSSSGTSNLYIPQLFRFNYNLKGSGTIQIQFLYGHTTSSSSSDRIKFYSTSQYPTLTITVLDGVVTDTSFNFRADVPTEYYYLTSMNVIVS